MFSQGPRSLGVRDTLVYLQTWEGGLIFRGHYRKYTKPGESSQGATWGLYFYESAEDAGVLLCIDVILGIQGSFFV